MGELLEQVLTISNSLEGSRSGMEDIRLDTNLDKPHPALISINVSGGCEERVQVNSFTLGSAHTAIDYIDEVSVHLSALCLGPL